MSQTETTAHKEGVAGLTLAAIGVVFGDIGTSPLYTMKEVFHGAHGIPLNHANILGVLSLIPEEFLRQPASALGTDVHGHFRRCPVLW
jgi:K+ transporter